jgi:MFS family permease
MRTVRRLADVTLEWNCVSACPRMSYTLRRRRDLKRAMLKNSEWRDFVAVTSSVAVLGLGLGSIMPLSALALSHRGYGADVVGWTLAATALGGIVGTLAAPAMTGWLGRRKVMLGCVFLAALSVMPLQFIDSLAAWTCLRLLFGIAMAPLFVLGEAWINVLPGDSVRGRIVAIYTTSFTICQVLGPLLTQLLTQIPTSMFLVAGGIFFLGVPGIAIARDQASPLGSPAGSAPLKDAAASWLSIIRTVPAIIAGAALFAAFDSIMLSFLPLTALGLGFSQAAALGAVSITFAGDAGLQIVAGSLADRYGRLRVQRICALLLCVLLPLMPILLRLPVIWAIYLFLIGGIAGAIYTLSLVASGERFSGGALVRASGLIALTWNISATAAPLATGIGAHWIGNYAWVAVLWLMALAFLVTLLASEPNFRAGAAWLPKSRRPRA